MPATYRVEWLGIDSDGNQHRYVSHNMPERDARAMAATLAKASATTTDIQILETEAPAQ